VLGDVRLKKPANVGAEQCVFAGVSLPAGPGRVEAAVVVDGKPYGAGYVDVKRVP
jgi:hypothetical protein